MDRRIATAAATKDKEGKIQWGKFKFKRK